MTAQPNFFEKVKNGLNIILPFLLIVIGLSIGTYIITSSSPRLIEYLSTSPRTPWGIVTSIFVHINATHLSINLYSLFLFTLSLLIGNIYLAQEELENRLSFTVLAVTLIPILLNIIWIIINPKIASLGSSGIVYTMIGIFVGFSSLNSLELFKTSKGTQAEKNISKIFSLLNLLFFILYFLVIVDNPDNFLSSGRGTNVFIHFWAFYSGLTAVFIRAIYLCLSKRDQSLNKRI